MSSDVPTNWDLRELAELERFPSRDRVAYLPDGEQAIPPPQQPQQPLHGETSMLKCCCCQTEECKHRTAKALIFGAAALVCASLVRGSSTADSERTESSSEHESFWKMLGRKLIQSRLVQNFAGMSLAIYLQTAFLQPSRGNREITYHDE